MVYYATYTDDLLNQFFIGVFSTSALAQNACQQWHDTLTGDKRRLLWIGRGDTLSVLGYEIEALELDYAVNPESYVPEPGE